MFEGLGELEGHYRIEINPEIKKSSIHTLLLKLTKQLGKMEQFGAIEKVDRPTEWVDVIVAA